MNNIKNYFIYILIFVLFLLAYCFTLPLDLIDIDTAQYGEIAREMIVNNDYLHLKDNGRKYLDKPILTFWTIALFFKYFGISNTTFRIPAILMLLISCWGIYKISYFRYKNTEYALLSSIIYLAIPGTYTFVLNPTIDIYLNTYLILIHLFYFYGVYKNSKYIFIMYLFLGLGVITKGPIAIVIPAISIGGDILFRKDWRMILKLKPISGIIITSILPLFWSYILYQDFEDFGPYFFLYLQSFGRFYMKIYDQGWNPSYFSLTFSWLFFTFIFILISYLYRIGKNSSFIFKKEQLYKFFNLSDTTYHDKNFVIEFWLFVYLILISFSKYRMPQYSFWNIPAAAVFLSPILANFFHSFNENRKSFYLIIPSILNILFIILLPIFFINFSFSYLLIVTAYILIYFLYFHQKSFSMGVTLLPIACAFTLTSVTLYPDLLKYQPSSTIALKIKELEPNRSTILSFGIPRSKRSYEFYSNRLIKFEIEQNKIIDLLIKDKTSLALVTDEFLSFLPGILGNEVHYEIIENYPSYKIATPKMSFLNKYSRQKVLKKVYLVRLKLKDPLKNLNKEF